MTKPCDGRCGMLGILPTPHYHDAPAAEADNAGERCECGTPLAQPDELESGLCLQCLNGPIRPTASPGGQDTGQGEELREAIAQWFFDRFSIASSPTAQAEDRAQAAQDADALLALPEVAPLLERRANCRCEGSE
jgi:hypothetical protein